MFLKGDIISFRLSYNKSSEIVFEHFESLDLAINKLNSIDGVVFLDFKAESVDSSVSGVLMCKSKGSVRIIDSWAWSHLKAA